jgi:exonuclease III
MRILCWNIRGLGSKGRRKQLKEWVVSQNVEVVCLQETVKEDFSIAELRGLMTVEFCLELDCFYRAFRGHIVGS